MGTEVGDVVTGHIRAKFVLYSGSVFPGSFKFTTLC